MLSTSAAADNNRYLEDFSSRQYCDTNLTTALWDTVAGELKLPSLPILAGRYDTPDLALRIAISGNYAFVADGASGLRIIDISDPDNPSLRGSYDTPVSAQGVAVCGNYALVADHSTGLLVINVSNPAIPTLLDPPSTLLSPDDMHSSPITPKACR